MYIYGGLPFVRPVTDARTDIGVCTDNNNNLVLARRPTYFNTIQGFWLMFKFRTLAANRRFLKKMDHPRSKNNVSQMLMFNVKSTTLSTQIIHNHSNY